MSTLLLIAIGVAEWLDPLPQGLRATYFSDANWTSAPVRSRLESQPATDTMIASWPGDAPSTFSVTWTGSLVVLTRGAYTFATASDDGSWLFVDGQPVVDNGGHHERRSALGTVTLDRGVHEIFVKYFQDGGLSSIDLFWGSSPATLTILPPWALWSRRVEFSRALVSLVLWRAWRFAVLGWLVTLAGVALFSAVVRLPGWLRYCVADPARLALTGIVVGSVAINVFGFTWGLPSEWAGDELTPTSVMLGLARHFANGWFDRYPPLQFYVLTAAYAPWLWLKASGWATLLPVTEDVLLFGIARLISVAAGAGTLVAIYFCGAQAFGRRAGIWAAAMFGLLTPFVYYAKTANPEVPYIFWFTVSLAFYVRAMRTLALRDIALVFAAAAAAICTKDQAYGLFLSIPFVLAVQFRRADRRVLDWRLWFGPALGLAIVLAINNLPFNPRGFLGHFHDITGPGSRAYRAFAPTLSGQLSLLRLTMMLDQRSWGWPFFVLTIAGLALAVQDRSRRVYALPLVYTAVTYYVAFIAVILYTYDRYLLPMCVVQALFGGVALEWLAARRAGAIAAALFGYTALYALTVDVLMWRDSRYVAERWLAVHAGRGQLVATVFPLVTEPRLQAFATVDIGSIENLRRWDPDYFVLNADYARAVPVDTPPGALVDALRRDTLGYELVFRYRSPAPWRWLPAAHADLVGPRTGMPVVSFLRDINPTIEIYGRATPARPVSSPTLQP